MTNTNTTIHQQMAVTIYQHLFEMAEQDELVADEKFEFQVVVYGVSNKRAYNTGTANATKQNPTTTNAEFYIKNVLKTNASIFHSL